MRAFLLHVAAEVFDHPIDPALTREFLADPRHHIAVAIDEGVVVGFASGVHYIHPDKPPEWWINAVAVAPTHRRRGLAKPCCGHCSRWDGPTTARSRGS